MKIKPTQRQKATRHHIENPDPNPNKPQIVFPFAESAISRQFEVGTDTWSAGDLTFRLFSQAQPVPDPAAATDEELRLALVPAVLAEISVDNTKGTSSRKVFFGYKAQILTARCVGLTIQWIR